MSQQTQKKLQMFFVAIAGLILLIASNTAEASDCGKVTIECGRILSVINNKKPNKVYRLCGKATIPASRSWFLSKCKLRDDPRQYLGMCRDFYPKCGCEKSPFYQKCNAEGYYYETAQKNS